MGLLVDKSDLNFGKRSWRYSMLVRDRIIEKMFLEPQKPGDPFEVSDADTMLRYLDPQAKLPDQVAILTRTGCSFCAEAKRMLDEAGYDYAEVPLPHTIRSKALGAIAKAQTVPQVFVNGERIGGSDELKRWLDERRRTEGQRGAERRTRESQPEIERRKAA
jgi:glutaredoxin-like protein